MHMFPQLNEAGGGFNFGAALQVFLISRVHQSVWHSHHNQIYFTSTAIPIHIAIGEIQTN